MRIRTGLMAWTAAVALAGIPATALAAVDAFIWFDSVKGDVGETSKDAKYALKDAFEIKDFSFGVENPTTVGSATGGAGAGKVKFNEFTIKKLTDKASPLFFRQLAVGRRFAKVEVQMRKAGGENAQQTMMDYKFTNVFVTKIDWSGPGDEGPMETITFKYGSMQVGYAGQHGANGPSSAAAMPPGAGQAKSGSPWSNTAGMPPPGQPH